jgi:hypothetical protein
MYLLHANNLLSFDRPQEAVILADCYLFSLFNSFSFLIVTLVSTYTVQKTRITVHLPAFTVHLSSTNNANSELMYASRRRLGAEVNSVVLADRLSDVRESGVVWRRWSSDYMQLHS